MNAHSPAVLSSRIQGNWQHPLVLSYFIPLSVESQISLHIGQKTYQIPPPQNIIFTRNESIYLSFNYFSFPFFISPSLCLPPSLLSLFPSVLPLSLPPSLSPYFPIFFSFFPFFFVSIFVFSAVTCRTWEFTKSSYCGSFFLRQASFSSPASFTFSNNQEEGTTLIL